MTPGRTSGVFYPENLSFAKLSPAGSGSRMRKGGWLGGWREPDSKKNPSVVCLGRARVDNRWVYRFSLLTLLFSGVIIEYKPIPGKKFRGRSENFYGSLNSCNRTTYSGIAGGRAAMSSANRASLRRPANSGSL